MKNLKESMKNEQNKNIVENSLDYYKKFKSKTIGAYEYGCALIAYTSIDAVVKNPTDEEYQVIFSVCFRAYMKSENSNWVNLVDGVAKEYSEGAFTLGELENMDKFVVLGKELCTY